MLTHDFQQAMLVFFVLFIIMMIGYGVFCQYKSKSFIGTGRVTDIQAWSIKATVTWLATFALTVLAVATFIF